MSHIYGMLPYIIVVIDDNVLRIIYRYCIKRIYEFRTRLRFFLRLLFEKINTTTVYIRPI